MLYIKDSALQLNDKQKLQKYIKYSSKIDLNNIKSSYVWIFTYMAKNNEMS